MKKTVGLISANYNSDNFGVLTIRRTAASLPYGGRYRLIDFALSNMVNSGITTVGLLMPPNYRSLIDHVEAGKEWDLNRRIGGLFPLPGSVYGVRNGSGKFILRDLIFNDRFLHRRESDDYVLMCGSDKVMSMDYRPFIKYHEEGGCPITLLYKKVEKAQNYAGPFLNVAPTGEVLSIEQNAFGNANCYLDTAIVDRKFLIQMLDWFASIDYMDFMEVLAENLASLPCNSFEFEGYAGFVEDINSYVQVNFDLFNDEIRKELFVSDNEIFTKVQDESPAFYRGNSVVKNSIVAAGSIIEGDVENCIISRNVSIAAGAKLKNCIVFQHSVIGPDVNLENVILDKQVKVSRGVTLHGTEGKPLLIEKGRSL